MFLDNKRYGLKQASDIGYFYNFKFDEIYVRYMKNKINEVSKVIPAYSFRSKNLFQAGKLSKKIT